MSKQIKVSNHEYYDKLLFIDDALFGMSTAQEMITESFEALMADNRSDFTDKLIDIYNNYMSDLISTAYNDAEALKTDIFDTVDDFVKVDDDLKLKFTHYNNITLKCYNLTEGNV